MDEQIQNLHDKALATAKVYKKCEADLISILQIMDQHRGYLQFKAASLYEYCTKILELSEGTSYALINVARKSVQVPALKEAIKKGELTLSKAHKIVSVLTVKNQEQWIDLVKNKTSREIEKAVAIENPLMSIQESIRYRSEDRIELKVGISEEILKKLERVMDLESQRTSKPVSREEAIHAALDLFLEKRDPVKKANLLAKKLEIISQNSTPNQSPVKNSGSLEDMGQRTSAALESSHHVRPVIKKSQLFTGTVRKPFPAKLNRAIHLRDQGQCTHQQIDGKRCENKRWLEKHHIIPVAIGGSNHLSNITTLCASHHKMIHSFERAGQKSN